MYCSHCGKEIEEVDVCPFCGCYARNYVAPEQPAQMQPQPVASRRQTRSGKSTAKRFFGKFFCVGGILVNLFSLFVLRSYGLMRNPAATFFGDLYYYIGIAMALVTTAGAVWVMFHHRKSSFKIYAIIPAVLAVLSLIGGLYGIIFEYYSKETYTLLTSVIGMVLVTASAALCALSLITGKNLLNLFSIITNVTGIVLLYMFFAVCLINKYYYAEYVFLIGCLEIIGIAFVYIFMLGAYNGDKKFELKNAPKEEPVNE
ncbi:MAG: hypothetical protein J6U54_01930 [Clostridiales bacterium]|nr:hypothetical protein [Clostridiales bacterium]